MIVYKFGGTSVQDENALTKVIAIIESHDASKGSLLIVCSAVSGITNELSALSLDAVNDHTDVQSRVETIRTKHLQLVNCLVVDSEPKKAAVDKINRLSDGLADYLSSITTLNECTDQSKAEVLSYGELMSTTVLCYALRSRGHSSVWHDARRLLRTSGDFLSAMVDLNATQALCEDQITDDASLIHVTQGFIASDTENRTMVLGRGGSDASAAIFGAVTNAHEIMIWTDVSGVYSGDPRYVANARPVPTLSFAEIRDLALYGAKVLHPDAILPAIEKAIPVVVKNTFDPHATGTTITTEAAAHGRLHAVTSLRSCIQVSGSALIVQQCIRSGNILRNVVLDTSTTEHGSCIVHTPDHQAITSVEVAVAGSEASTTPVALTVVTGPTASEPETIARITSCLSATSSKGLVVGLSKWTTYIVVAQENVQSVVEALHDLVLEG